MRARHLAPSLALLLAGCGLDTFDVHGSGRSQVQGSIAAALLDAAPLSLDGLTSFDIKSSREFKNQGAKPGDIDSVKLTSLSLALEAPPDGTLDFIDHADFFASAPGHAQVKIATLDVPDGARTVHAKVLDAELKDLATAPSMTLTAEVTGRQPTKDTTIRADVVLSVDVAIGPF